MTGHEAAEPTPPAAQPTPAPELGLTARQSEVTCLLVDGLTYAQIAARLALSEHTVHEHVRHIYERLGGGRSRVIAALIRSGLCDAPPK